MKKANDLGDEPLELVPSWDDDTSLWLGDNVIHPDDIGISLELQAELRAWRRHWATHVRVAESSGWDSPSSHAEFLTRSASLVKWLSNETGNPEVRLGPPRPGPDAPEYRLSADWGHPWSLWSEGAADPDELGLSPALRSALREWTEHWEQHARFDGDGWDSPAARARHEREGDAILEALRWEAPQVRWVPRYKL